MLKTSSEQLADLARSRSERVNIGSTAAWLYPSQSPIAKVLMIHGFRGNHLGLSAIAGAMTDMQVLIPDLPGFGKTSPLNKHSLDEYGTWLKHLVEQLDEGWIVLGHSFGSLVVANAIGQGMLCKAVVLQNPITTRSSEQKDFANRIARAFYRVTPRLGRLGSAFMRSWLVVRGMSVAMATTKNLRLRSWIHSQHAKHFSCYQEDRVALEGFEAASSGSVMDYSQKFSTPVLLIAGERDMIAPLRNQLLAEKSIASAELSVIPNVGHLTHYETPNEVAQLVRDFVAKIL